MTNGKKTLALTWLGSVALVGNFFILGANWYRPAADATLVAGTIAFLQLTVSTVIGHLSGASKPDTEKTEPAQTQAGEKS